jgi:hypothetical protein
MSKLIGDHTLLYLTIVYNFTAAIVLSGILSDLGADAVLAQKFCIIISMTIGGIIGVRAVTPAAATAKP